MTKHSRLKVGTFLVEFNTPGSGQILKASGCDFVLVDMEHSGFSISDIKQILRYMQAADLPVIVRCRPRNITVRRGCSISTRATSCSPWWARRKR